MLILKHLSKLTSARIVLYFDLHEYIVDYSRMEERPAFKIVFINGYTLSIRYNDFNEYSYQLEFSSNEYDRIRYDNYDKHWDVSTTPNHLHERGSNKVVESPMTGDPKEDMIKLIEIIKDYLK